MCSDDVTIEVGNRRGMVLNLQTHLVKYSVALSNEIQKKKNHNL